MRIGFRLAAVVVLSLAFAGTAQAWNVKYADGPDPAVSEWPSWPYPVGCLSTTFDAVATFSGPTDAEQGTGGPEQALRGYLEAGVYPQLPTKYWRPIVATDTHAVFASGELALGLFWLTFDFVEGSWKLAADVGECRVRTVREGNVAADWKLVQGAALKGGSRRIEVRLHGRGGCDGGRSLNKAAEPEFRKVGKKLLLTIWLKPLPPGVYSCEKRIEGPLEVKLPGRLGDRHIWDAGSYPPVLER